MANETMTKDTKVLEYVLTSNHVSHWHDYYTRANTPEGMAALGLSKGNIRAPVCCVDSRGFIFFIIPSEGSYFSAYSGSPGKDSITDTVEAAETITQRLNGNIADLKFIVDKHYEPYIAKVAKHLNLTAGKISENVF
jgi:hypothetical protein